MIRVIIEVDPSDPDKPVRRLRTLEIANRGDGLYSADCYNDERLYHDRFGIEFRHEASDGLEVCVRKALEAVTR